MEEERTARRHQRRLRRNTPTPMTASNINTMYTCLQRVDPGLDYSAIRELTGKRQRWTTASVCVSKMMTLIYFHFLLYPVRMIRGGASATTRRLHTMCLCSTAKAWAGMYPLLSCVPVDAVLLPSYNHSLHPNPNPNPQAQLSKGHKEEEEEDRWHSRREKYKRPDPIRLMTARAPPPTFNNQNNQ